MSSLFDKLWRVAQFGSFDVPPNIAKLYRGSTNIPLIMKDGSSATVLCLPKGKEVNLDDYLITNLDNALDELSTAKEDGNRLVKASRIGYSQYAFLASQPKFADVSNGWISVLTSAQKRASLSSGNVLIYRNKIKYAIITDVNTNCEVPFGYVELDDSYLICHALFDLNILRFPMIWTSGFDHLTVEGVCQLPKGYKYPKTVPLVSTSLSSVISQKVRSELAKNFIEDQESGSASALTYYVFHSKGGDTDSLDEIARELNSSGVKFQIQKDRVLVPEFGSDQDYLTKLASDYNISLSKNLVKPPITQFRTKRELIAAVARSKNGSSLLELDDLLSRVDVDVQQDPFQSITSYETVSWYDGNDSLILNVRPLLTVLNSDNLNFVDSLGSILPTVQSSSYLAGGMPTSVIDVLYASNHSRSIFMYAPLGQRDPIAGLDLRPMLTGSLVFQGDLTIRAESGKDLDVIKDIKVTSRRYQDRESEHPLVGFDEKSKCIIWYPESNVSGTTYKLSRVYKKF